MKAQTLFSLSFIGLAVAMPQQQPSNGAIKFPNANDDECDRGKAMAGPRGTICIGAKGEIFGPPGKTKSKVDGQARPDGQVVKGNTGSCPDYVGTIRLLVAYRLCNNRN